MKAFVSRLGPAMSDFLSYKHALGNKYTSASVYEAHKIFVSAAFIAQCLSIFSFGVLRLGRILMMRGQSILSASKRPAFK